MKPFLSFVIPTLNEERYLPHLLDSLVKQKQKDFEVVIVDGNSTDKTKEIAESYNKSLNIKFIQVEKGALSPQKNIGGEAASGEYLVFLDADMLVFPLFTKIAKKQITNKKGLLFLPYVIPLEKKDYPEVSMVFPMVNQLIALSQNFNKPFGSGPAMVFEKMFFKRIGGFDDIFGEDHQIIRKAYLYGVRAKFIPSLKVKFSLRRMKKDGRIKLFRHFIMAHAYLLFHDKLNKGFTYEMGGHLYQKPGGVKVTEALLNPNLMIKKIRSFFRTLTLED